MLFSILKDRKRRARARLGRLKTLGVTFQWNLRNILFNIDYITREKDAP